MRYRLGAIIQEFRKRKRKTQEELSEGHCEPETLSRIEAGSQQLSVKLYNELMEEMDCSPVFFTKSLSPSQYERVQLEQEIHERIEVGDYEIQELLDRYKACAPDMDEYEKQFYQYESAYYVRKHGGENAAILAGLVQAMQKTFDGYTLEADISDTLLLPNEIIILYTIARCLAEAGKRTQAILIMKQLYNLYKSYELLDSLISIHFDSICRWLSKWLLEEGLLDESLQTTEEACTTCIKYSRMKNFPYLLYTKSSTLLKTGKVNEGRKIFHQAYAFFEALGNDEMLRRLQEAENG